MSLSFLSAHSHLSSSLSVIESVLSVLLAATHAKGAHLVSTCRDDDDAAGAEKNEEGISRRKGQVYRFEEKEKDATVCSVLMKVLNGR